MIFVYLVTSFLFFRQTFHGLSPNPRGRVPPATPFDNIKRLLFGNGLLDLNCVLVVIQKGKQVQLGDKIFPAYLFCLKLTALNILAKGDNA